MARPYDDLHKPGSTGYKRYLTFNAARQNCAMEAECILAIIPQPELLSVSGRKETPRQIVGLFPFQGRDLVVVDVAKCLGGGGKNQSQIQSQIQTQGKVLVAAEVLADQLLFAEEAPFRFGFLAERVAELRTYHVRDLKGPNLKESNLGDRWLTGQGRRRRLLDWRALGIAEILGGWKSGAPGS